MPNFFVFNSQYNPLFTQLVNTYTTPSVETPPEGDAAKAGILYILTSNSINVPIGQNLLLQVSNPVGSGKTVYISSISGGASAAATVTLYSGGTITGGTSPTPFNTNFSSTNSSVMTTKLNTGSLGGTFNTFMSLLIASGLFILNANGGIIVPPGESLTVSVGTGSLTASGNITWWEY
jgi:hypothetical protein